MRPAPLLTFFLLAFAVAWMLWIAASTLSGSVVSPGLRALLFLPGTFAPAIIALALISRTERRQGVEALLRRLFRWRVALRWYVFAVSYMAAIKLSAALLYRIATGSWPHFGDEAWYVMLAAAIFSTVVGGQAGEEIGWRGYALPQLEMRFGLALGSLVLGVIWAAWHLPLFFLRGGDLAGQSFPYYLLALPAISAAMAWLYWRTGGSLLLTMLMHAAINNTTGIVPAGGTTTNPFSLRASLVGWLTLALLWIVAAYFLVRMALGSQRTTGSDAKAESAEVSRRLGG
jgi:CAAX protease family protein